jgi:ankyrin repeat protein
LKLLIPLGSRHLSSAKSLESTPSVEAALLPPQVDIEKTDWWNTTILDSAIRKHRTDLVRYLLQLGAQATLEGRRPGICLAAEQGHIDIVSVLLDSGASPGAPDPDGWMALHLAAYNDNKAVTQILLFRGAEISAPTTHWAAFTVPR